MSSLAVIARRRRRTAALRLFLSRIKGLTHSEDRAVAPAPQPETGVYFPAESIFPDGSEAAGLETAIVAGGMIRYRAREGDR